MGKIKELLQGTTGSTTVTWGVKDKLERSGVPLEEAILAIRSDLPDISRLAFPTWREKDTVGLSLEGPAVKEGRFETLYAGLYDDAHVKCLRYSAPNIRPFIRVATMDKKGVEHLDKMLLLAHNLFTTYPTDLTRVGLHINDFTVSFNPFSPSPGGDPGLAIHFRADSVKLSYGHKELQKYGGLLLLE